MRRIRLLIELVESLDKELRRYRAMLFLKGIRRFDRELIEEGFSPEEIRRRCDIRLRVITLKKEEHILEETHPINIFKAEHEIIPDNLRTLEKVVNRIKLNMSLD